MDVCTFNVGFSGDRDSLYKQAKQVIRDAGGTLMIADNNGCFSVPTPLGTIQGDFDADDDGFQVAITKKPFFVSCGRIEQTLQRLLRDGIPDDGGQSYAFTTILPADSKQLIPMVAEVLEETGGIFAGDATRGFFGAQTPAGMIEGSYAVAGQRAIVQVDRCPLMLGRGAVEAGVREKLQIAADSLGTFEVAAKPQCDLRINFTGSAEERLNQATTAIADLGGSLNGNAKHGRYTIPTPVGRVEGRYTVSGQTLNALIDTKPIFVSCNRIEKELRSALGS